MHLNFTSIKELIMEAAREWSDDKASRLGAALAYYTVFSIAPLLLITIAIVGFVFGDQAASGGITGQISGFVGPQGAEAIQSMIAGANKERGTGIFASIISSVLLLFGASGVFVQLKDAMNTVWDVPEKKSNGIMGFIKDRFLSFGMVLGVGFILLASLIISTVLTALGSYMGGFVGVGPLMQILNFVVSFAVITALFAMIYKFVPDIKLPWRDVWLGAALTAFLFSIGKYALGLYLGRSSMSSAYGAAGSFVVLLVWIYYSAQIVFFGAELTQVYSHKYGAWKGRKKKTVKAKEASDSTPDKEESQAEGKTFGDGVPPGSTYNPRTTVEKAAAPADLAAAKASKPNVIGKAAGTILGLGVAAKAIIDGLSSKKE